MRRILVLGPPGSGKSTLARRLGERLDISVIHLDTHFWEPGWEMPPEEEWIETQRELMRSSDTWILDGNYDSTLEVRLPAADTVVLLSMPPWRSVYRILTRWLAHRGEVREDMAAGCLERFDLEFVRYAWSFRRNERPEIKAKIDRYGGDLDPIELDATDPSAIDRFLDAVEPG